MIIQHNLTAINANRMLGVTTTTQAKTSERLSSGYKINRAADDAAGLSISEKMRKQVRGLGRASTNADDGISSVQTAEGAMNEVHDMMQRLNELSVQAANGTNSYSDREAIQNEIDQILTEVDRVAETTKFNETYLLKGASGERHKYMKAHDAGLEGTLGDSATIASFTMQLKCDSDVRIAGKEYHVGMGQFDPSTTPTYKGPDSLPYVQKTINSQSADPTSTISYKLTPITIDGTQYDSGWSSTNSNVPVYKFGEEEYTKEEIASMIIDGTKVSIGGYGKEKPSEGAAADGEYNPNKIEVNGVTFTAIDPDLDKNLDQKQAIGKAIDALEQANRIGVDPDQTRMVSVKLTKDGKYGTEDAAKDYKIKSGLDDITTLLDYEVSSFGEKTGYFGFYIEKQYATVPKDLGISLHVGSEADLGNKISINLEAMKTANLGIQNLNVKDTTGMAATYAIDAIEDALRQVSAQRSALGAVQNRLEHTINNLDNVVENTTAAESRIRDTNMAEAMVEYSKMNILAQAGQSMLAQANQSTQGVMSLLQ
ncbi:MAG: flagellar hook protein [Butyrivibrio sp.]|nr:flagellar hook protein [Butyrivibrio sp.]